MASAVFRLVVLVVLVVDVVFVVFVVVLVVLVVAVVVVVVVGRFSDQNMPSTLGGAYSQKSRWCCLHV